MVRKAMNPEVLRRAELSFARTLEEKGEEKSNRLRRLRTLKRWRKLKVYRYVRMAGRPSADAEGRG